MPIFWAKAMRSHEMINGIAVAKIVFLLPKYSMNGPPRMPPTRPARGIIPPTQDPCKSFKSFVKQNCS